MDLLRVQSGDGETSGSIEATQAGRFEDLFSSTLTEMGFLSGQFSV